MAKILVIDDSPSMLALVELILREDGHEVLSSLSAIEAMKLAVEMPADLIITDLYMPEKDGLEILQEARRALPRVPVIAISGAERRKDMLSAARILGAGCTLRKPFSKEQLLRAVATVMEQPDGGKLPAAGEPLA